VSVAFRALCQFDVSGYREPTLDELLAEPSVRMLMARDGVDEALLRDIAKKARERLRKAAAEAPRPAA
jgi:hypothetical protein